MKTYSIEYQAGRRYMVCAGQIILKEGLASREEAKAEIQRIMLYKRMSICTWSQKKGHC